MKIVLVPNAFKGTLTASQAAAAMARGIARVLPSARIVALPAADGGDGTLDVLCQTRAFRPVAHAVTGPLGTLQKSAFAYHAPTRHACIETALACGLVQVPESQRSPLHTTSHGVGELIAAALAHGATTVTLGIGGTATVDGGLGAAQALGARFYTADGTAVAAPMRGSDLARISHWDLTALQPLRGTVRWDVLCDAANPLCGPQGAAAVFGPQKGATPADVTFLDAALQRLFTGFASETGRSIATLPGAGCGGGLGAFALQFLCDALTPGSDAILDLLQLDGQLRDAAYAITGEGCLDAPSLRGKIPGAVLARAQRAGIPAVALVGQWAMAPEKSGFAQVVACTPWRHLSPAQGLEEAAAAWAQTAA